MLDDDLAKLDKKYSSTIDDANTEVRTMQNKQEDARQKYSDLIIEYNANKKQITDYYNALEQVKKYNEIIEKGLPKID